MPELKSLSLAIILSSCGFGFIQTSTATMTQPLSPGIIPSIDRSVDVKNVSTVALAKKCTIRRYRRPR